MPFTTTLPLVGRSSKLMQRTSVDFPAPDSPMMPKISPSSIVRLISLNAVCDSPRASYVFDTPRNSIIVSAFQSKSGTPEGTPLD